ncbi:Spectinomycin tetracycline efflux pump [Serratia plymuthica]|uniref:Spectinomycin tetracycline efflux pump n=1 Tax=Serratia plymuthica TaxID=82996 RepID=A0A2X4XIM6_SERPL|nr:Spectinomycin tetracycline efflux pump [Serratia plymuthica]
MKFTVKSGGADPRWILVSLSLSMLLSSLGTSIANVGLPTLAQAFNTSFQAVQWVVIAYLLAITTSVIALGRLGDRIGRRRLLLVGIALFTFASVLCALAPNIGLLFAARIAQGLGAAVMMAMTMALVGETLGKDNTGRAMGLLGTMSAIGTALGPSLGGALIFGFGWRAMFLINLPVGLLAFILAYRYLPAPAQEPQKEQARFDYPGTLLLGLTLASYALSMTLGRGDFGWLNLVLLLCAVLGIGLFVWVENSTVSPLIHLAMFRQPGLSAGLTMSLLVMAVMMTTLVVGAVLPDARSGAGGGAGGISDVGRADYRCGGRRAGRPISGQTGGAKDDGRGFGYLGHRRRCHVDDVDKTRGLGVCGAALRDHPWLCVVSGRQ